MFQKKHWPFLFFYKKAIDFRSKFKIKYACVQIFYIFTAAQIQFVVERLI